VGKRKGEGLFIRGGGRRGDLAKKRGKWGGGERYMPRSHELQASSEVTLMRKELSPWGEGRPVGVADAGIRLAKVQAGKVEMEEKSGGPSFDRREGERENGPNNPLLLI